MNSLAITICSNHLDIYLIDTREYGRLVADRFMLDIWLHHGLANFNLSPHCDLAPIFHGDVHDQYCNGRQMTGAITLVDADREVINQVEFTVDARSVGMLGFVLEKQKRVGWMREEVEERTWWAVQDHERPETIIIESGGWLTDGNIPHHSMSYGTGW